ncbi:MAG: peptide deformylase [Micromonosporaceae bacterium]
MTREPEQPVDHLQAFIGELRHWRDVRGLSQKALAARVGYTSSYVSKVESGAVRPSREFVTKADQELRTGRALVRRWQELRAAAPVRRPGHPPGTSEIELAPEPHLGLVVLHEDSTLTYADGHYRTRVRRHIRNVGTEPVTQYLIRISVDRYPGDPERSNRLYRGSPLTWEEVGLTATCNGEPMTWRAIHDRDAFKELWLLFENADGRFPLYPGESAWLDYTYRVGEDKWGHWWKRAIRLPTRRLSLCVDLPVERRPVLWGMETSMTAEAFPLRTPIDTVERNGRVVATWSTDDPPLHARYRIEWRFREPKAHAEVLDALGPADRMASLGVVQLGDPILANEARSFDLPREADDARRVISELTATMERVAEAWTFAKGMGVAAPQIGIGRAAALVRTPEGQLITLLNPRVVEVSRDTDEQYEGCLSFFDVRCMVPRPLTVHVEHQDVRGQRQITVFEQGVARLVAHEIDHLRGVLCRDLLPPGVAPIPITQYQGTGAGWQYRAR